MAKYLRKKEYHNDQPGIRFAVPFFLTLAILTVVSFIIPLRPTQSYSEKRNLAEFPSFSMEALVSGDYFDDITTWFSDTFPGRESWIQLSDRINGYHGHSEIMIQGDIAVSETIPPTVPEPPEKPLQPTQAAEPEEEPDSTEAVPEATEPAQEEGWGGVQFNEEDVIMIGAVIQIGDSAFSSLAFSSYQSENYTYTLSTFADTVAEQGVRVVSAPAPTAIGIMVEKQYLEQLRSVDQSDTLNYMHAPMSENVLTVDTVNRLLPHNDEYIYFRTDHHWTALGAYYVYEGICEALGYTPAALDSFEPWDMGEFQGSLYGKVQQSWKLKLDTVTAYIPEGDITMYTYENNGDHYQEPLLDDTSKRNATAKYLTFLSSDNTLNVITNDSLPDGPSCIVVKDSYGNCLVPFLTQNYHKIYAIDYRKFYRLDLIEFCEKYDVDDVLFIPYMTATQSSLGNELLMELSGIPRR